MTFSFDSFAAARAAQASAPIHVYEHSNDFPHIIQLPDGRMVAANHEGRPFVDRNGHMQTFQDPSSYTRAERAEVVKAIREHSGVNIAPLQAPDANETAAIRAHLEAKYPGVSRNDAAPGDPSRSIYVR